MSIFFGIWQRDKGALGANALARMGQAVQWSGFEPLAVWQKEAVALGIRQLRSTPESCGEVMPLEHGPTGVVLTAQVRLDNRKELLQSLEIPAEMHRAMPDGELLMQAYLRWGEGFAERLLGDFAIAVWDPREEKMVLVRDHHGTTPLFYYGSDAFLAFSNTIKALLALPEVPKQPNLLKVSQILATWPSDGVQTAYADVMRVPAGHMLVATRKRLDLRSYWELQPDRKLTFRSDEECLEAFLEIYDEAVRCRLRSTRGIGGTLSGGLDSGSVCALAARELRTKGQPFHAFTSVPMFDKEVFGGMQFGDEAPLAESYRAIADNLDLTCVRSEKVSPMAGVNRLLELIDEPVHGASNAFWFSSIFELAQQKQIGVLLTGQFGNATVSFSGGKDRSMAQKARQYLLLSWARPLRNLAHLISNRGAEPWMRAAPLNPEFVRKIELRRLRREGGQSAFLTSPTSGEKTRLAFLQLCLKITASGLNEAGYGYGLDVLDPTGDKRLMEFCLAIPISQFHREGLDRALVRRSMKGIMPDEVRLNRKRGRQAADLGYRILASLPEIQEALSRMERHPLASEVLDLPKMQRVLPMLEAKVDKGTTDEAGIVLMRGLMAGRFLERF